MQKDLNDISHQTRELKSEFCFESFQFFIRMYTHKFNISASDTLISEVVIFLIYVHRNSRWPFKFIFTIHDLFLLTRNHRCSGIINCKSDHMRLEFLNGSTRTSRDRFGILFFFSFAFIAIIIVINIVVIT